MLCTTIGGQESDGGERLERSVGDGESKPAVVYELAVELTLHVEMTLHAELVLLDDGLVVEAIDGQADTQARRPLSHFGSPDLMR